MKQSAGSVAEQVVSQDRRCLGVVATTKDALTWVRECDEGGCLQWPQIYLLQTLIISIITHLPNDTEVANDGRVLATLAATTTEFSIFG